MMRKFLKYLGYLLIALIIGYMLGPRVKYDPVSILDSTVDTPISQIAARIAAYEGAFQDLKPNNQARIIWANDSIQQQTDYCLVYLHGFSASQMEGDPIHRDFAKRYGMNLYLPRLEDHGRIDTNSFYNLTPDNYLQSAEDAIDIAKILGKKVIIMTCSSGSTVAIPIAAAGENIDAMIHYSPNIDIADPMSEALLYPWGKQISSLVMGGSYNHIQYSPEMAKYWNPTYHMNGVFALKSLIKNQMTEDNFKKIKMPTFLGYYYKDDLHQDNVVSVPRMLEFYDQISTPIDQKYKVAIPNAGHHVISSSLVTKDLATLQNETYKWAEKVLKLVPKQY
jgi:pimeloyl-ACP methyl ester carboxylesterase